MTDLRDFALMRNWEADALTTGLKRGTVPSHTGIFTQVWRRSRPHSMKATIRYRTPWGLFGAAVLRVWIESSVTQQNLALVTTERLDFRTAGQVAATYAPGCEEGPY